MFIYLFKAIVCSGIFYSLYALLFNKEKMLVFNRFYLLGSLVTSFVVPLITIPVRVPVVSQEPLYVTADDLVNVQPSQAQSADIATYINYSATAVLVLISCYLLMRFLINFSNLRVKSKTSENFYINNIRVVLLKEPAAPHSFLNTIYLSKAEYESASVETEIMAHEMAHIHQKHSWDILFIELLKVFTWFNPFIYLYKRSVKINHELLADAAVVKQLGDVRSYQVVLLQRVAAQSSLALASSFTFYITKKRLTMLVKKSDKKRNALVSLALIPVTALVIVVGCNTEEKRQASLSADEQKEVTQLNEDALSSVSKDTTISLTMPETQPAGNDSTVTSRLTQPKVETKKFAPPKIVRDMPEGLGATSEELITYEASIDRLKTMQSGTESYSMLMEKAVLIHNKMTKEQEAAVTPLHPPLPPGPPPAINRSGIETVRVSAPNGKPREATIIFKNGNVAKGDVSTPEKMKAFEEKYNVELPPPPPPAPPTRKKKAVALPPPAAAKVKASLLHHPLSGDKIVKMPELARANEKKARSGSVRSDKPLSTEMVSHILQLVEKSYTAIAVSKGTSDWGIDNPIKTRLDF
ncbi:M56 family metallopeptidase [Niabella sp. 22666]|uniref:M56 family metallopeptidase n=1 Tax=Niabella sp. 22666 TaxID=3453954 RepID=UPI003F83D487